MNQKEIYLDLYAEITVKFLSEILPIILEMKERELAHKDLYDLSEIKIYKRK